MLGPNGAGKSTLMNMITDNLKADEGEILLDGREIHSLGADYRGLLGYMPQQQGLYDDFTGERFLWYMAALKGLKKREAKETIENMLELVNLKDDRYKKLKSYSGGMKQRILIAQALLNDPKILIMDEPTAGLDPKERIRIRNFISEISKDKIVLLATHVADPDPQLYQRDLEGQYCSARDTCCGGCGIYIQRDPHNEGGQDSPSRDARRAAAQHGTHGVRGAGQ